MNFPSNSIGHVLFCRYIKIWGIAKISTARVWYKWSREMRKMDVQYVTKVLVEDSPRGEQVMYMMIGMPTTSFPLRQSSRLPLCSFSFAIVSNARNSPRRIKTFHYLFPQKTAPSEICELTRLRTPRQVAIK